MEDHELIETLEGWANEIRDLLTRSQEVPLRANEVYDTRYRIEDGLQELGREGEGCFDKKEQRQADALISVWRLVPVSGERMDSTAAHRLLNPLLSLITTLVARRERALESCAAVLKCMDNTVERVGR